MQQVNHMQRFVATMAPLELVTAAGLGTAMASLLDLEFWPTMGLFGGLAIVRLVGAVGVFRRFIYPALRLQERFDARRKIAEDELRRADRDLENATSAITLHDTLQNAASFLIVLGLYHLVLGPPGLRVLAVPVTITLAIVALFGFPAVLHPLGTWMLSDISGKNYLIASELGVDLERKSRSLAVYIAGMGFSLTVAPGAMLVAVFLSAQGAAAFASAEDRAALLSEALHRRLLHSEVPVALEAAGAHEKSDGATLFVIDAHEVPSFWGVPAPAWATPEFLAASARGDGDPPQRGAVVRSSTLGDGRIVGAITTTHGLAERLAHTLLPSLVVLVVFGPICAWLLSRSVALPLEKTAERVRRVATKGDLSELTRLPVAQFNEIGVVGLNLNDLVDRMRRLAAAAGRVGGGVLTVEITGDGELPRALRGMQEQLRGLVQELQTTSQELAGTAAEISAATEEQEAAFTVQSSGMVEISETMSSLSKSAAHVATAVQGVLENAERTQQNTDQMVTRIDELTGHAGRIGDILDVIREIANRTDLLALNGSLEASRAGEVGVGFSLVASEMRRLAERVTGSVSDIKQLVADIRESGATTVLATEESRTLAEGTAHAARGITMVTQQQQSSTEQVAQNVRLVTENAQQAGVATSQTRASAGDLMDQARRLTELVARFRVKA